VLLQRLRAYAEERLNLPPTLYAERPVRYIVELDRNGRLLSAQPTDTADPASARTRRGQPRLVPQVVRSSGVRALLLADNAEYTLGLARPKSRRERVAQCHTAYLDLLERCAAATGEPLVRAVLAFLRDEPLARLDLPADFDAGATITFRVDGVFPVDLPAVQAFWAAENDPAGHDAQIMQCIVCGQERPILDRLQGKIKGIPGGQTSGTAIISANAEAFESYGLKASRVAPTCALCGERFTQAATALLRDDGSHVVVGSVVFVFWTRRDVGFSLRDFFTQPRAEDVQRLIMAARSGRRTPEVDDTAFYATVLSASGGRAVVRDWLDTTVGEVKKHLGAWFARQAIVDPWGQAPRPMSIFKLARATVRELRDVAPPLPRALLMSALTGAALPQRLLYEAVRRCRAEQDVDWHHAALIKLVRASYHREEEDTMVALAPDHPSVAYHCGRLLAVLEAIQRRAVPGAKATIVDRFFGTASSAPAGVFGRLLRGAQPHLAKLERDNTPAYVALQRRLEEISARIGAFPRTLTLEEQGLFALGYYHQRAHDRAAAQVARHAAGQALPEDEHLEVPDLDDAQSTDGKES
jgi:CRISPR-associated protein Csd1